MRTGEEKNEGNCMYAAVKTCSDCWTRMCLDHAGRECQKCRQKLADDSTNEVRDLVHGLKRAVIGFAVAFVALNLWLNYT